MDVRQINLPRGKNGGSSDSRSEIKCHRATVIGRIAIPMNTTNNESIKLNFGLKKKET